VELRTPLLLRSVYLDSRTLIVCMHLGGVAREEKIRSIARTASLCISD
jgi:hypothetical protein